jgi:hypothetical protein
MLAVPNSPGVGLDGENNGGVRVGDGDRREVLKSGRDSHGPIDPRLKFARMELSGVSSHSR